MYTSTLSERDQKFTWHPFTQHALEAECLPVVAAQGAWLKLEDGQQILDAISSWWVNLHGHSHPAIAQAIYDQACQLEHVIFAGFTHAPAVNLAEILIEALQARGTKLSRCFYTDNGATSVEAAMKMAYQFHKNCGITTRTRFISLTHSYHGDTLGSMMLGARDTYSQNFKELLHEIDFVAPGDMGALKKCLQDHEDQYAALIVEPLVQAANGMLMYSAEFLSEAAKLCKQHGVLLICDEVFTGFYRTGTCFAFEQAAISPDIICLSKGISGGFLPLGATIATEAVFETFLSQKMERAFWHSHSYTANPLACTAAIASWRLLHQKDTQAAISRIAQHTRQWIERLALHPNGEKARSLGTIGAIDLREFPDYFSGIGRNIRAFALEHNVLLRPIGPTLYAVPPYCISNYELDQIYGLMELILDEVDRFK